MGMNQSRWNLEIAVSMTLISFQASQLAFRPGLDSVPDDRSPGCLGYYGIASPGIQDFSSASQIAL
jgi:hypothetical protein